MKNLMYLSLAVLLMAGCVKENVQESDAACGKVFTASFENSDTKVYVDGNLATRWTADDRISIFTTTYNDQYKFDGNTGDDNGTFSKVVNSFNTGNDIPTNYAVYPYSSGTSITTSGTISLTLPSVQNYAENSYGLGANTMVAATQSSSSYSLRFKSLCGFLVVKLYGEGAVKSISIKGNNGEKIAGSATVTPVYGQAPEVSVSGSGSEEITIDCGSGVTLGKTAETATSFWLVIPPVTFSKGFTVTAMSTSGGSMVKSVSTSKTIQRNVKASMSALEAKFEGSSCTDLSSSGTANSYIVSNAGKYKFKTVKGNSSESVGTVKGVKVLWETFGTDTAPTVGDLIKDDVSYADNYITFNTNDTYKEGNAVIAAYSDAACTDGKVLWSWHIWLTDQPEEQVYNNNAGTMMDRNLGATSATPGDVHALGLLYQWGRKDPFLGGSSISGETVAASTLSWPSCKKTSDEFYTLNFAISHPTTFFVNSKEPFDWLTTSVTHQDLSLWDNNKTKYDPCPIGYQVPIGGSEGIWSVALGSSSGFNGGCWFEDNRGFDFGSGNGKTIDKQLGNATTIWYPLAGCRYYYSGVFIDCGVYSEYWSCTSFNNGSYNRSRTFCLYPNSALYSTSPNSSILHAYGFPVRCQKIERK